MKRDTKLALFAVVVLACVLTTRAMARDLTSVDTVAARADSATVVINTVGFTWSPNDVTIQVGDSVTWNANFSFHPLRQVDGPTSDTPPPGGFAYSGPEPSFTYQFNSAGTFYYQCANHGLAAFGGTMRGRIVVQAALKHTHGNGDFKPNTHTNIHIHCYCDFKPNIHTNIHIHCGADFKPIIHANSDTVSLLPTRLPATGAEVKRGRPFDFVQIK